MISKDTWYWTQLAPSLSQLQLDQFYYHARKRPRFYVDYPLNSTSTNKEKTTMWQKGNKSLLFPYIWNTPYSPHRDIIHIYMIHSPLVPLQWIFELVLSIMGFQFPFATPLYDWELEASLINPPLTMVILSN